MKRLIILLLPFLLTECKPDRVEVDTNCQTVDDIFTPPGCYDKTKGLKLTARNMPEGQDLLWVLAPLSDTISLDYTPVYLESDSSSVIIPDSIVADNQKIGVVFAGTENCISAYYFSFVRRYSRETGCEAWFLQEKFVIGD